MGSDALLNVPDRALSSARMKVVRAAWAASYYRKFDRGTVLRIADAVAKAGYERAAHYAEWAVRETGYGVAEHKTLKNQLSTHNLLDYYRDLDLVTPRVDQDRKIIELPVKDARKRIRLIDVIKLNSFSQMIVG